MKKMIILQHWFFRVLMSLTPLYLVPGLVCLFWVFVHSLLARSSRTYGLFCFLFGAIFITSCGDVLTDSLFGSDAISHLVVQFFAPTLIPLCCMYFHKMSRDIQYGPALQMWIIVPSVLFTASFILTLIMGLERTDDLLNRIQNSSFDPANADSLEHAYYLWTIILFRIVIIAEELFLLVYCFVLLRKNNFRLRHFRDFLFRSRAISVMGVQVYLSLLITLVLCLKVFLHPFFLHSPGWAVAISLTIAVQFFSFGFFALFGSKRYITRKDIRTAMRYNYTEENQAQVTEDIIMDLARDLNGESLTRVLARLGTQTGASPRKATRAADTPSLTSAIFSSAADTQGHESLATRFQHLMQVKRLFLQPGLTLSDVADELGTNKTYVSKMVNNTYNLGFPELLNIMRVDYACEYIRRHPEASQEEIARACGFFSASSFNGTFKRITGFTPKVWAARKDSLHLD